MGKYHRISQGTQINRFISLYFTDNQKGKHMSDRLLTDDQLTQAVELFAQGRNRVEVAQYFIDNDPTLMENEATDPKGLRKRLSNALRVADPTSQQFSATKYKDLYEIHKAALQVALGKQYERAVLKSIKFLEKQIDRVENRLEALEHLLDNAIDTDIIGAGEYAAIEGTLIRLTDQMLKLQTQYQESLSFATRIAKPTPDSKNHK